MCDEHFLLHVFVYGTLKRGHLNHTRLCTGYVDVFPAQVAGKLYLLADRGCPMLVVPSEAIITNGSHDISADMALGARLAKSLQPAELFADCAWDLVEGEVVVFDDALTRLPQLDALETFRTDGSGEYRRVAIWTQPPESRLVWTYVAPCGWRCEGHRRLDRKF
jgi:gamma-glutamylcyclotransferase (GGCT)/AIG2-like uncharacterized protein YtfP